MSYLFLETSKGVLEIGTLAHDITHTTTLADEPGKLTFMLEKDPNSLLYLHPGQSVWFEYHNRVVFRGNIFTIDTDSKEIFEVTAYDQSRYLSNKWVGNTNKMSLMEVFTYVCTQLQLPFMVASGVTPPTLPLTGKLFWNNTFWEVLSYACYETNLANAALGANAMHYFIQDRAGILTLDEIQAMSNRRAVELVKGVKGEDFPDSPLPGLGQIVLGEGALLTDFSYSVSIENVCNSITLVINGEQTPTQEQMDRWISSPITNSASIARYGKFSDVVEAKNESEAELRKKAQDILNFEGMPEKTLRIEALGVDDFDAGSSFLFNVKSIRETIADDLGVPMAPYTPFYVESAEHYYNGDFHSMSLEVALPRSMVNG